MRRVTLSHAAALPIARFMKMFSCGDVVPGCHAHGERDTDDDILAAVARHAADVHGLHPVPADVADAVRAADAAARAITRADWPRPLMCTDDAGRYVGVVRMPG